MTRLFILFVVVFSVMLVEARRASLNERAQRARGGIEPPRDVYAFMQIAYPSLFLLMLGEGMLHGRPSTGLIVLGLLVFTAGKLLKWWAIVTLGRCWTFRVIVVPGAKPVEDGPYRFLRHPNYVGVVGELVGVALLAGAPVAGVLGTLLFVGLMALRIRVENRALDAILRRG